MIVVGSVAGAVVEKPFEITPGDGELFSLTGE